MDYSQLNHSGYKNFKSIQNCVYQFVSPSGKSYIGITKNFYSRYLGHKREANERAKLYVIESPSCEKFEVCLDENLKIFCKERNLDFGCLLKASKNSEIVQEAKPNNAWKNRKDYIVARNNTVGWKITKYRRKDYEILSR